ncbi:YlbL family protein [Tessaracoccus antarcticus]|uniref:YlbL family protein n=1 Tax=Tessaracoccus antarcticus TaxID=2479848 RepID=UPI001F329FD9|nr:PDZ domain-containing protein [Tessaracoccus antarcticus]
MSRNVVAIVSSIVFVILAALLVVTPVPFVTWRPGTTVNVLGSTGDGPLVEVKGVQNYPTGASSLLMTTVSTTRVDANVSLPEALLAHLNPHSDTLPRDVVYPVGLSDQDVREEAVAAMDTSRSNATVAALGAAGQSVKEMPMVESVVLSGPANDLLRPGDLIEEVDGKAVKSREEVVDLIAQRSVGDVVGFKVLRDKASELVLVKLEEGSGSTPVAGINVGTGFNYAPEVIYRVDSTVVGPSAGLVFSLAIYDKITEPNLLGDEIVAGTGAVDSAGKVGAIGGVREKIAGAEEAGASVFLLPTANCVDVGDLTTTMRLVPVSTLKDAIRALQKINEGKTYAEVPTCG